jgi:hypothetical protein
MTQASERDLADLMRRDRAIMDQRRVDQERGVAEPDGGQIEVVRTLSLGRSRPRPEDND